MNLALKYTTSELLPNLGGNMLSITCQQKRSSPPLILANLMVKTIESAKMV